MSNKDNIFSEKSLLDQLDKKTPLFIKVERYIKEKYPETWYDIVSDKPVMDVGLKDLYTELKGAGHNISIRDMEILLSSNKFPQKHPVKEYFENLSFYGFGHIEKRLSYIKLKNETPELRQEFILQFKKHLVRCVAQTYNNLDANRYVFVIRSFTQHNGKTTYIRTLNPFYRSERSYYKEQFDFKHPTIMMSHHFIINIEELAGMRKNDLEELKYLISSTGDSERMFHTQTFKYYPRLANLFASTNKDDFLEDGINTRWIIFDIIDIDYDYYNIKTMEQSVDIDDLWSESVQLYKDGFEYSMSQEELNISVKKNKKYLYKTSADLYVDKDLSVSDQDYSASPTDVADYINLIHEKANVKAESIGKALKKADYEFYYESGSVRYWCMTDDGQDIKARVDAIRYEKEESRY